LPEEGLIMFVGIRLLLFKLLMNCVLIILTTLFEGIWLDSVYLALGLAAILVVVNFVLPFVILLLSIPLNLFSLAVAVMLTNAAVLGLLGYFVPAFHIADWHSWLAGSIFVGGANFIVSWLLYRPALRSIPHTA
jgi:uncharacterized membrane protein YvlD (DUF360 family)